MLACMLLVNHQKVHLGDGIRMLRVEVGRRQTILALVVGIQAYSCHMLYVILRKKRLYGTMFSKGFFVFAAAFAPVVGGWVSVLALSVAIAWRVYGEMKGVHNALCEEGDSKKASDAYHRFLCMLRAVRPMYEPTLAPYIGFTVVMLALTLSNVMLYMSQTNVEWMEFMEFAISLCNAMLTTLVFCWILLAAALIPYKHRDVCCVISELSCRGDDEHAQSLCLTAHLMNNIVGFRIFGQRLTFGTFVKSISIMTPLFTYFRALIDDPGE